MRNSNYKVLITTSGIGSRLGEITDFTNKSLVVVGDKPAISYIIEKYPSTVPIVITLGHFGDHVRQFLNLAYPDRIFEFVEVKPYRGPGSSLAYSILQARHLLQQPFIFHASDSLVMNDEIPTPEENWVGGAKSFDATNYASFDVLGNNVTRFHDKGMVDFDYLHIGVIGIHTYKVFWTSLAQIVVQGIEDSNLNDLSVLQEMLKLKIDFRHIEFPTWLDIGNSHALVNAQKIIEGSAKVLRKNQESISFIGKKVLKFFSDSNVCSLRIKRADDLSSFTPKITGTSSNFLCYEFAEGKTASHSKNPLIIRDLLTWADENLWEPRKTLNENLFAETCKSFYRDKTNDRINMFLDSRGIIDQNSVINDLEIPKIEHLLPSAMEIVLSDLRQTRIHGDFILDNIIVDKKNFTLIDWRQDFGGSILSGDIYYDLAKLNHSLQINHEVVSLNLFEVEQSAKNLTCSILLKDNLVDMRTEFQKWINEHNYDLKKISVLTSLIWLNMAPLHHHPFDLFLYNYGKYNLARSLK
jgi:NDP-sugar pyrophosphorylase family protein